MEENKNECLNECENDEIIEKQKMDYPLGTEERKNYHIVRKRSIDRINSDLDNIDLFGK